MLCTPVSSSNEAALCEECDHLLDFEENCALYSSCWRYFNVKSLFPSHFTRRLLRTSLLASKHAQLHAKYDHLLDFDDTLSVISLCWRYFDVYTLFPFYFTRRVLCTPVSSTKEADLCEKCDHLLDFEENCAIYSSCWRYFNV